MACRSKTAGLKCQGLPAVETSSRQPIFSPTKTTTIYFPFLHPITNSHQLDEQPSVVPHEPQSISVEGSESLDDALSDLKKRGYDTDLNFETNTFALYGGDLDMGLNPEGFHVDEIDHTGDEAHPNDSDKREIAPRYLKTLLLFIRETIPCI